MLVLQISVLMQFLNKMKVFDSFDIGWQYAKKHGWALSLILLGSYFVTNLLTGMCFSDSFMEQYMKIAASTTDPAVMMVKMEKLAPEMEAALPKLMLVLVLSLLIFYGVINIALSIIIGETKGVSLKYISLPFGTYLKVVSFTLLMFAIFLISAPTFEIPFVFFGIQLFFTVPILLEHPECSLFLAMKQSWILVKGRFFSLLGFCLLALLVLFIGILCLFVGVFFAQVVVIFAYLAVYKSACETVSNS